jgi:PPOX class probable F420-dependent enzyme
MLPERAAGATVLKLPDDTIDALLDRWPVARLATVGPDGQPHAVPVVFARVAGELWSPIDGKPKSAGELARVRHLRAEPRASLLLDHYEGDWRRLWWLRVDVRARIATPPEDLEPAVEALLRKYPQYRETDVLRDPPTLLALRPVRRTSWCAGRDALPMR